MRVNAAAMMVARNHTSRAGIDDFKTTEDIEKAELLMGVDEPDRLIIGGWQKWPSLIDQHPDVFDGKTLKQTLHEHDTDL